MVDDREVTYLIPNATEEKDIELIYSLLLDLESVPKYFQPETATMADVNAIIDDVPDPIIECKQILNNDDYILRYQGSEAALAKIQEGSEQDLTANEGDAVKMLLNCS